MRNFLIIILSIIFVPYIFAESINVAKGATVTASHANASGTIPSNVADGNRSTFSQVYGNNYAYWDFDLKAIYNIDSAHYQGYTTFYLCPSYKISAKYNIGDSWTEIVSVTGNTSMSNDHTFAPVTARYWRIEVWSNYVHPILSELELYQTTVPEPTSLFFLVGSLIIIKIFRKK